MPTPAHPHTKTKLTTSSYASQVYHLLTLIPRGKVVTYGQIATMLGNPHLARVVGNILHHNPSADRYPCYKVVNSSGRLAPNFAFGGTDVQRQLLEAEGIKVINNHVNLKNYRFHYDTGKASHYSK